MHGRQDWGEARPDMLRWFADSLVGIRSTLLLLCRVALAGAKVGLLECGVLIASFSDRASAWPLAIKERLCLHFPEWTSSSLIRC